MTTGEPTSYEHIALDERGTPWIPGANTKVVEIVAKVKAHGWSPEELAYQLPHLTLGQIHSALAYYWDHVAEIDRIWRVEKRTWTSSGKLLASTLWSPSFELRARSDFGRRLLPRPQHRSSHCRWPSARRCGPCHSL